MACKDENLPRNDIAIPGEVLALSWKKENYFSASPLGSSP